MNYFTQSTAAERYSKARPNFHPSTIKRIKEYLLIENKVDSALDIACGTGLSTQALLSIATHVYGTDNSKVMLDVEERSFKNTWFLAFSNGRND